MSASEIEAPLTSAYVKKAAAEAKVKELTKALQQAKETHRSAQTRSDLDETCRAAEKEKKAQDDLAAAEEELKKAREEVNQLSNTRKRKTNYFHERQLQKERRDRAMYEIEMQIYDYDRIVNRATKMGKDVIKRIYNEQHIRGWDLDGYMKRLRAIADAHARAMQTP